MKWFARLHSNFNALATLWDTYLLCLNRNAVKQVSDVLICSANNVTDHYGKTIEVLHRHPFEGWPDMARPSHSFWQIGLDGCALLCQPSKGHPCRVLILLPIMFYCIISTTYQKIGNLFCPLHISGLSHSVHPLMHIRSFSLYYK